MGNFRLPTLILGLLLLSHPAMAGKTQHVTGLKGLPKYELESFERKVVTLNFSGHSRPITGRLLKVIRATPERTNDPERFVRHPFVPSPEGDLYLVVGGFGKPSRTIAVKNLSSIDISGWWKDQPWKPEAKSPVKKSPLKSK